MSKEAIYERLQPELVYITQVGLVKLQNKLAASEQSLISKKEDALVESDDEWVHHNEAARDARLSMFRAEDDVKRLRTILSSQIAIIEPNESTDIVDIGNTITVEFLDEGETDKVTIVGKYDGDANETFVSYESPMAMAILGRKRGDEVSFEVGQNRMQINVKVKKIEPGDF